MRFALVAWLLVVASCGNRDRTASTRDDPAPERQRRVVEPPSTAVRALPPHAIRADGVGPYKLGDTVARVLDQLPSGPRITQFMIPGIVRRDILRAEDDAILIGAEPQGKATFVAVVRGEIARTEAGIAVGSTREELAHALGGPLDDPDRAQDPHIVVPSGLKNAHVLFEDDRIAAIVVAAEEARKETGVPSICTRPKGDREKHEFGACLASQTGELVRYGGEEIDVLGKDPEKPQVVIKPVPGLVYAAALRNPADGRDDIVAIVRTGDAQTTKTWSLVAFRVNETKLARIIEPTPVFQLTAANARWIGAELRDVDLYLELTSHADAIEVGGLLVARGNDKIRDVVVISPFSAPRKRGKSTPHELDAGTSDSNATEKAPR